MEAFIAENLWPGLIAWVFLYISDYAMTILGARMYHAGVKETIVFEGSYELNPHFQKDVDALRRISPRFVFALTWTSVWLAALWFLASQAGVLNSIYVFTLGALLLMELAIHVRHIRNLVLFRGVLSSESVRGRIEYPKSLTLRVSLSEFFLFAAVFLIVALVTGSWFVFGGAAGCFILALKHYLWIRKYRREIRHFNMPAP